MTYQCRVCGEQVPGKLLRAREMMYGTRESFDYISCSNCASMQIVEAPPDMGKYYRSDIYSSWKGVPPHIKREGSWLRKRLVARRTDCALNRPNLIGKLATRAFGPPEFPYDWRWFSRLGLARTDNVMDFGCGSADLLWFMRANGFSSLVGVDPYAELSEHTDGLTLAQQLDPEWKKSFDLVMLHHSLEHLQDTAAVLAQLTEYVRPGGALLIRIPVAASFAADAYGADWVQLDAPRHVVLPSEKGMRLLAGRLGLAVETVEYDSTAFQFIGSEQYRLDIPMYDSERSWMRGKNPAHVELQRPEWSRRADELNARGAGDQAAFYFRTARRTAANATHPDV